MEPEVAQALSKYLLALANDELILGHRDSEWCSHAPLLEEDIAFANLALDELGHASTWQTLLAELNGEDVRSYPDKMVFFRQAEAFGNSQLVELPLGDWAFSIVRQFLFDAAEKVRLESMFQPHYSPLAEALSHIRREEVYHYRHTSSWVQRLSFGTKESRSRI